MTLKALVILLSCESHAPKQKGKAGTREGANLITIVSNNVSTEVMRGLGVPIPSEDVTRRLSPLRKWEGGRREGGEEGHINEKEEDLIRGRVSMMKSLKRSLPSNMLRAHDKSCTLGLMEGENHSARGRQGRRQGRKESYNDHSCSTVMAIIGT